MNNRFAFSVLLALALTACSGGKPSAQSESTDTIASDSTAASSNETEQSIVYDATDALAFGLSGYVQSATTECYSTYESDGELKEGSVTNTQEVAFDEWGHVTRDEWGNEYGYDADGNYYRGNHVYTVVKRDKGRRLTTIAQGGWTGHWTEKRIYQSGNIYPSKAETTADYEGGGESMATTTYQYNRFDEHGNWTERTCVTTITETEEDPWSETGTNTKISESITIEKRTISYYDAVMTLR